MYLKLYQNWAFGSAAGVQAISQNNNTPGEAKQNLRLMKHQAPIKIKSVKAIGVKSAEGRGSNLVMVKVETTEPGFIRIRLCNIYTDGQKPV